MSAGGGRPFLILGLFLVLAASAAPTLVAAEPPTFPFDTDMAARLVREPAPASAVSPCPALVRPALDRLLRSDPAFRGGDGASSLALGNGRILWLFGDTFIAPHTPRSRRSSVMVRNAVGVQTIGPDGTSTFRLARPGNDQPRSFFPEDGEAWYWPGGSALLDGRLLIFLLRVVPAGAGTLGFAADGVRAVMVDDPSLPPEDWSLRHLVLPPLPDGLLPGSAALAIHEGHLIAFGVRSDQDHAIIALRWPLPSAARGDLSTPHLWCGPARGWRPLGQAHAAAALVPEGQVEYSVHRDAITHEWVIVQTQGFGAARVVMHTAPAPEGPWSGPVTVWQAPPDPAGVLIWYAARAHPEQPGPGLALTLNVNALSEERLMGDDRLYYPRCLTLQR